MRDTQLWDAMLTELVRGAARVPARLVIRHAADERGDEALALAAAPGCGVSSASGLWLDGRRITAAFPDGFRAARALLRRTDVHCAVCVMTVAEVKKGGVPLDRWDAIEWPGVSSAAQQADIGELARMLQAHGPAREEETTT